MEYTKLSLCLTYIKSSPIGLNKFYRGISDEKLHGFRKFTQFDHLYQSLVAENVVTNRDVRKKKLELNTLHHMLNLKY